MKLYVDDWVFEVDVTATMAYSAQEAAEHCCCAYCRNFYAVVDREYPQLRVFLAQFGIDLEAPDELLPLELPTQTVAAYGVSGRIMKTGSAPMQAGDLTIYPETAEASRLSTFLSDPYFFLRTDRMQLTWSLEEPMDEVESPAMQEAAVKRSAEKLLSFYEESNIKS